VCTFAYIDCDIVHGADVDKGTIAIYHYQRGTVVSRNVADDRAKSSQKKQVVTAKLHRPTVVRLRK